MDDDADPDSEAVDGVCVGESSSAWDLTLANNTSGEIDLSKLFHPHQMVGGW